MLTGLTVGYGHARVGADPDSISEKIYWCSKFQVARVQPQFQPHFNDRLQTFSSKSNQIGNALE
jgi:hypothetical protein